VRVRARGKTEEAEAGEVQQESREKEKKEEEAAEHVNIIAQHLRMDAHERVYAPQILRHITQDMLPQPPPLDLKCPVIEVARETSRR
jgi:hypothetical protein